MSLDSSSGIGRDAIIHTYSVALLRDRGKFITFTNTDKYMKDCGGSFSIIIDPRAERITLTASDTGGHIGALSLYQCPLRYFDRSLHIASLTAYCADSNKTERNSRCCQYECSESHVIYYNRPPESYKQLAKGYKRLQKGYKRLPKCFGLTVLHPTFPRD